MSPQNWLCRSERNLALDTLALNTPLVHLNGDNAYSPQIPDTQNYTVTSKVQFLQLQQCLSLNLRTLSLAGPTTCWYDKVGLFFSFFFPIYIFSPWQRFVVYFHLQITSRVIILYIYIYIYPPWYLIWFWPTILHSLIYGNKSYIHFIFFEMHWWCFVP